MSYKRVSELPNNANNNLSEHAQEIYLTAFNNAWDEYKNPGDRQGSDHRETVAHKVAWSTVKQSDQKRDGRWVRKG